MSNTKQYLDYTGLTTYHNELVQRLEDLEFEPNKIFANVDALVNPSNWMKNNRIAGLKEGLMVTVDGVLWQLVDADKFKKILEGKIVPESLTAENLGWDVVIDFNVNDHILVLTK